MSTTTLWPASAAPGGGLAEASRSLGQLEALKEASGEPAGRRLSNFIFRRSMRTARRSSSGWWGRRTARRASARSVASSPLSRRAARRSSARASSTRTWTSRRRGGSRWRCSMVKVPPWQCPARLLCLLRARLTAPAGSALSGARPSHWAPSHCLECSSQPPPISKYTPTSLRLTIQALGARELRVRPYFPAS